MTRRYTFRLHANTAPERECSHCGRWGHWWGTRCPYCGK
jgi:ribosomal protein L32